MYDITSSLIIDNSSLALKCGLAKQHTPTYFHRSLGDIRIIESINFEQEMYTDKKWNENLTNNTQNTYKPFIKGGNIMEPELCAEAYKYIITDKFNREPENIPILICDSLNSKESPKKALAEYMFEELKISVMAMVSQPVLSLFSTGLTSGLVIDAGYGHTQIAPIIEGYVLKSHQINELMSNEMIDAEIYKELNRWKSKGRTSGLIEVVKGLSKGVSLDRESISQQELTRLDFIDGVTDYMIELPDGNMANIGFLTDIYHSTFFNKYKENLNLSRMCLKSLYFSYMNIQKLLSENILFVGGNSNITNIQRRLIIEMEELDKTERTSNFIFKLAQNNLNPEFNSYIGGCIVTELANANAYWITKTEYEESGDSVLLKKLPNTSSAVFK